MGLLSLIVLAPLIAAVILLVIPDSSRGLVRLVSILGSTVSLIGSLIVAHRYDLGQGGVQMEEKIAVIPRMGINWHLGVDGWGVSLLLLTAVIIFAETRYLRKREQKCWAKRKTRRRSTNRNAERIKKRWSGNILDEKYSRASKRRSRRT